MQVEHEAKPIYLFKHKHSLAFTALSETDKCISECERGGWIKNEIASAKISPCHCLTLCFGGRSAMEQLTGIINVFSPEDSAGENKQRSSVFWRADTAFSHHGHHLQVLQIRPLCGQQLLGDEVGPVCWEPLQRHRNREETVSKSNPCLVPHQLHCLSNLFLWVDLQENTQLESPWRMI